MRFGGTKKQKPPLFTMRPTTRKILHEHRKTLRKFKHQRRQKWIRRRWARWRFEEPQDLIAIHGEECEEVIAQLLIEQINASRNEGYLEVDEELLTDIMRETAVRLFTESAEERPFEIERTRL